MHEIVGRYTEDPMSHTHWPHIVLPFCDLVTPARSTFTTTEASLQIRYFGQSECLVSAQALSQRVDQRSVIQVDGPDHSTMHISDLAWFSYPNKQLEWVIYPPRHLVFANCTLV